MQDVLLEQHQRYAPSANDAIRLDPAQILLDGGTATVQDLEVLTQPMLTLDPRTHTYRLHTLSNSTSDLVYDLVKIGSRWLITRNN